MVTSRVTPARWSIRAEARKNTAFPAIRKRNASSLPCWMAAVATSAPRPKPTLRTARTLARVSPRSSSPTALPTTAWLTGGTAASARPMQQATTAKEVKSPTKQ
ncbi:hypothetical protein SGLAM104S_09302 [Streptomyces glaucescens]